MGRYGITLSLIIGKLHFLGVVLFTFNIAINCYSALIESISRSLFGSLFKCSFKPNAITLPSQLSMGNNSRAIALLTIMDKGSCKHDIVVYTTIIDNLCKDRMVDDALKLFSEMKEQGIRKNVVTYTSLIHGLLLLLVLHYSKSRPHQHYHYELSKIH
ncbi:hypothetical protein ACSBR1_030412 [Camellia fascicularis]